MATIESLQAQVIALQASEAKLTAENEKLTDDIDDAVELHFADLKLREVTHKEWDTLQDVIAELEAENEKLKDFTNWENHPALKHKVVLEDDFYLQHLYEGELIDPEDYKKLKADNEKLFQFIIQVNGTEEHVEKMIVERMSKEFIDGNQDWWDQMELFQEEEKEECLECGKSMEYDAETEKNKCFDGCAPH